MLHKINRRNFEKFNSPIKSTDIVLKIQRYNKINGHDFLKGMSPQLKKK